MFKHVRTPLVWGAAALLMPLSAMANADSALPYALRGSDAQESSLPNMELLGTLDLSPLRHRYTGVSGLSGLAFDPDQNVLYAVSDSGRLVHFKLTFNSGRLVGATVVAQHRLKDQTGKRLSGKWADSEGLVAANHKNKVRGDTELLISFERHPRVARYTPQGKFLGYEPIATVLRDIDNYQRPNSALEAMFWDEDHGIIASPEFPLDNAESKEIALYSPRGVVGTLPRLDETNAAIVALEKLTNGRLVTLERAHSWLTLSLKIVLRVTDSPISGKPVRLDGVEVGRLDNALGWRVDNFEGLTHHQDNRFFMVSDDNGQPLQKTLLTYFRINTL